MIFYDAFIDELEKIANGDEEEEMKGPAPSKNQVLEFFKKNPNPSDDQFHDWAEDGGFNVHKAEEVAYSILSNVVTKGESKGKVPPGVDPAQIAKGTKVEAEHTPDKKLARKIALDHIKEHRGYYPALAKMEAKLEKEGSLDEALGSLEQRFGKSMVKVPGGWKASPEAQPILSGEYKALAKKHGREALVQAMRRRVAAAKAAGK